MTVDRLAQALDACIADIELWMMTYHRQAGSVETISRAREALAAYRSKAPAEAHGDARWPLAKYSQRQQKWCAHYQRMTGFEPLMCDFEAGNQSFVEAAKLSVYWYESHTGDMFLAITRRPIPGSEYDMGDDHE